MAKRLCPQINLPDYAFTPGRQPHPLKEGGHSFGLEEPKAEPIVGDSYKYSIAYLYGLDLFNSGYYWESHTWWEALWNAHNRKGETADFFKALIKMAAAGVKARLNQNTAALGHLNRAIEIFDSIHDCELLGFKIKELISLCNETRSRINSGDFDPEKLFSDELLPRLSSI